MMAKYLDLMCISKNRWSNLNKFRFGWVESPELGAKQVTVVLSIKKRG